MDLRAKEEAAEAEPPPACSTTFKGTSKLSPQAPGPSLKACHNCNRIHIGQGFRDASPVRTFFGLFFVYAPVFVLPFVLLGGCLVYIHLKIMGATNLKTLRDFLPDWKSHRYQYKTQIVKEDVYPYAFWARLRAYWIFNCSIYCPLSVAILEWTALPDQGGGELVVPVPPWQKT